MAVVDSPVSANDKVSVFVDPSHYETVDKWDILDDNLSSAV